MFQLYASTTSAFKRKHNINKSKFKNSLTTTGFISQSHIQTCSTDIQDKPSIPNSKMNPHTLTRNSYIDKNSTFNKTDYNIKPTTPFFNKTMTIPSKSTKPENTSKKYEMRKLKMKLHKLINLKKSNLCNQFDCKNDIFNRKVNDYFQSQRYINRNINYHKQFHFIKNELGEAHDKYSMVMDLNFDKEYSKQQQKRIKSEFNKQFTEQEKKTIMLDPAYFISNKKTCSKLGIFKNMNLLDRLNDEEEIHNKKMLKVTKKDQKFKRNQKRFMTIEHKQILDEIKLLKESQLTNIKDSIEFNRAESRKATLINNQNKQRAHTLNLTVCHNRNKSDKDTKRKFFPKKTVINGETDELIKKAVNKDHNKRINCYFKNFGKKNKIEEDLVELHSKVQVLGKKKYPIIPIIKEHNLTESCKMDYTLMLNKKQLEKIDRFIEKEKYKEELEYLDQVENEFINKYTNIVRDEYRKHNINK